MYIRCLGSRGSISVSGKEFLKYGGGTTCLEVRSRSGDVIAIDAGTGIRSLGYDLEARKVKKIDMLFTHAHWDHLVGFPFFVPLYHRDVAVTIWGDTFGLPSFRHVIEGLMRQPYFPIQLGDSDIAAKLTFKKMPAKPFHIGGLRIAPIPLSHPRDGGTGFRFEERGKTFVFLTDNELGYRHDGGLSFKGYVEACRGADLLVHDAEYDPKDYQHNRSWGHSVFTDTVRLGLEAGAKQLGLFHHNNRRTDRQVDAIVAEARRITAKSKSTMKCFAVATGYKANL
jgi:phosphoribosyl 1,2-cyclic phosphodiesterase